MCLTMRQSNVFLISDITFYTYLSFPFYFVRCCGIVSSSRIFEFTFLINQSIYFRYSLLLQANSINWIIKRGPCNGFIWQCSLKIYVVLYCIRNFVCYIFNRFSYCCSCLHFGKYNFQYQTVSIHVKIGSLLNWIFIQPSVGRYIIMRFCSFINTRNYIAFLSEVSTL